MTFRRYRPNDYLKKVHDVIYYIIFYLGDFLNLGKFLSPFIICFN